MKERKSPLWKWLEKATELAADKETIRKWLEKGKQMEECTHVVIVYDTFDHHDYPVFVKRGEDIKEVVNSYNNPQEMSSVMEVYSMTMDIEKQLEERRVYHL